MKTKRRMSLEVSPKLLFPEVGGDFTRREFLVGVGLIALAPGCGGGEEEGEAGGASGEARTVEHKYGSTEISGLPKRVVSVGFNEQDTLLALGIKPVGVSEWYGEYEYATWPWATDELGGAEPEVLSAAEINFEAVAALEPDLIVGVYTDMTEDEYDTLSRISPTIAQSGEYMDFLTPWQEMTRAIGRAVGRRERAEEIISGVEARFAEVRERRPEFEGASAVVASFAPEATYAFLDARAEFFTSLGFRVPEEIRQLGNDNFAPEISAERLDLLDRDILVWLDNSPADFEDNELYQTLDVSREGRDIFLSDEVLSGALSWSTVLSIPYALERLVPMLAAAVDGDPETEAPS